MYESLMLGWNEIFTMSLQIIIHNFKVPCSMHCIVPTMQGNLAVSDPDSFIYIKSLNLEWQMIMYLPIIIVDPTYLVLLHTNYIPKPWYRKVKTTGKEKWNNAKESGHYVCLCALWNPTGAHTLNYDHCFSVQFK